jgi:hypothetical protein
MNRLPGMLCAVAVSAATVLAAGPSSPGKVFDQQLSMVEKELVPLAEAMPAEKYNFAPSKGAFEGVRTFGQQVTHVASVIYVTSASVLGEKNPSEPGPNENGPASLKTKDEMVKYLKDSFAYAHKAMAMLTDKNLTEMVESGFGEGKVPRLSMVTVPVWHSYDHYGQMVVYARMNDIIPPASRR